ncbi:MAG: Outer membrane protein assembly factor BamA [Flavobacteriales bacterium]|nr:MAG: outer membrane protein assembly factor BamA [Flavobacteriales bacterium]CAI8261180.1 MAG: Outer membrane protein assembly factor BamA [Flavobacteriales bacterium]
MEKQANNLRNNLLHSIFLCIALLGFTLGFAQETTYDKGKIYELGEITVTGVKSFSPQTVVAYTGLKKGQRIQIPGEEVSATINKLWKLELFSDIEFFITKIEGDVADLELYIQELPTLSEYTIKGIKKGKIETIVKDTDIKKGKKLSKNFLATTKNYIENKYRKDGFLNAKVTIDIKPDTTGVNNQKMLVSLDRGDRVKVRSLAFDGNSVFSNKKLRKKFKNTRVEFPGRFWKRSKYIEADFDEDLKSLLDFYKEKGYRDARIVSDTIIIDANKIDVDIAVQEGNKYFFGEIDFIGNSIYSDAQLSRILGLKPGDTYNGVLLRKRIADQTKPDGDDLTNLYQNNGYLFSSINPVEVSATNDTIDFEIRITEGKPAYFNRISVRGNDRTNDHVIYREIRTRPGELYSKDKVVRSVRELGQLGFFDAEQITPDFKDVDPNAGTVDIEYGLVERGASQIELQGGYGGGGFIGTLGLSFNNFSMRNIWNKEEYKPVPMGDGQQLSLRLQASRFFETYSFSFAEPWLGGEQPVRFSTSISQTTQYRYDYMTGLANKNEYFKIRGINFGLAKRLQVPDDYFTLSQTIGYQYFDLNNYYTGLFTFGDGVSNNLFYAVALSRNNTFTNPIFPVGGSSFTIGAKFSFPYSLVNNVDYGDLENQPAYQNADGSANREKIDQEKFRWLEYYKLNFEGSWYTRLFAKLILRTHAEFGFLGAYNNERGIIPFERYYLGGDGLAQYALDGREMIALRGYENQSLSSTDGSTVYNKFSLELRYPITLKPSASIYALSFLEAGNGYNNFREFNPFNSKRSAGFGVRIFMPAFGLLGIDFGYGFDSALENDLNPHGWETHFIIGQQF